MSGIRETLAVAAGGAVGAVLRYGIGGWVLRIWPRHASAGTLAVNVVGCFVIGAAMVWLDGRDARHPARMWLVTGLLGSLTTFSTFGYQTIELAREGSPRLAIANVAANVIVGLLAVLAGAWCWRAMK